MYMYAMRTSWPSAAVAIRAVSQRSVDVARNARPVEDDRPMFHVKHRVIREPGGAGA